jgi:hypothetical protein
MVGRQQQRQQRQQGPLACCALPALCTFNPGISTTLFTAPCSNFNFYFNINKVYFGDGSSCARGVYFNCNFNSSTGGPYFNFNSARSSYFNFNFSTGTPHLTGHGAEQPRQEGGSSAAQRRGERRHPLKDALPVQQPCSAAARHQQ